ncbi:hypothetical protein [Streptomyces jeddahensis]|uniref:hypothetical protein n=1 Tax=Streptomyces jeddahensis TaxID=1716141 RepID=UPI002FCCD495
MRASSPDADAVVAGVLGDAVAVDFGAEVSGALGVLGAVVVPALGAVVFGVLGDVVTVAFGAEAFGAEVCGAEGFAVLGDVVGVFDAAEEGWRSQLRAQRCQSASVHRCWKYVLFAFAALWDRASPPLPSGHWLQATATDGTPTAPIATTATVIRR